MSLIPKFAPILQIDISTVFKLPTLTAMILDNTLSCTLFKKMLQYRCDAVFLWIIVQSVSCRSGDISICCQLIRNSNSKARFHILKSCFYRKVDGSNNVVISIKKHQPKQFVNILVVNQLSKRWFPTKIFGIPYRNIQSFFGQLQK